MYVEVKSPSNQGGEASERLGSLVVVVAREPSFNITRPGRLWRYPINNSGCEQEVNKGQTFWGRMETPVALAGPTTGSWGRRTRVIYLNCFIEE
jgi:hypothetical protein